MPKRELAEEPLSPHRQWTAWELEVLALGSTVAPLEIEEATARNGWSMRSWRVETSDRIALDAARWSWATACAWIASLSRAKAEEGVAAFRKWRGREWRNLIGRADPNRSLRDVETELRNALAAGTVKAWAFQGSRAVTIPAAEWPGLEWLRDAHGEVLEFDELLLFGEPRYRRVTVSRAEVMRLWLARDGWAPVEVAQPDPPGPVEDKPEVGTVVEELAATAEAPIDRSAAEEHDTMSDEDRQSRFCAEARRLEGHWTQPRLYDHLRNVFPDLKPTFKEAAAASKFLLQVPKRGGHGPQPSRKKPLKPVKSDIRG